MTATETFRADLAAEVRTALAALADPLDADRVHDVVPADPITPCAYLGPATRRVDPDLGVTVSIPVVVIVDGADVAQVRALDRYGDAVWDAARAGLFDVDGDDADVVDTGAGRLRRLTVTVSCDLVIDTFCRSTLTAGTPGVRHG